MRANALFLSVAVAGAASLFAMPASAQEVRDGRQLVPSCRASAALDGSGCTPGRGPAYSRQGGRLAHAIMFFGGSGAEIPERPDLTAGTDDAAQTLCRRPAREERSGLPPTFARPAMTY